MRRGGAAGARVRPEGILGRLAEARIHRVDAEGRGHVARGELARVDGVRLRELEDLERVRGLEAQVPEPRRPDGERTETVGPVEV